MPLETLQCPLFMKENLFNFNNRAITYSDIVTKVIKKAEQKKNRDIFHLLLGPTQPPIQWVPVALSPGVSRPRSEADHSPPSNAAVKNTWCYTSTPNKSSWRGA
jgi:hypothetical protein